MVFLLSACVIIKYPKPDIVGDKDQTIIRPNKVSSSESSSAQIWQDRTLFDGKYIKVFVDQVPDIYSNNYFLRLFMNNDESNCPAMILKLDGRYDHKEEIGVKFALKNSRLIAIDVISDVDENSDFLGSGKLSWIQSNQDIQILKENVVNLHGKYNHKVKGSHKSGHIIQRFDVIEKGIHVYNFKAADGETFYFYSDRMFSVQDPTNEVAMKIITKGNVEEIQFFDGTNMKFADIEFEALYGHDPHLNNVTTH